MDLKDKIIQKLESFEFKTNFEEEDMTYINAPASKNIIYYAKEMYPNAINILIRSEVYNNYMMKKIVSYINLEHELEIEYGSNNTGAAELAKSTIIQNIDDDLQEIESLCKEDQSIVQKYYPQENEIGFSFTTQEKRFTYVDNLEDYDLDKNVFIISKSE